MVPTRSRQLVAMPCVRGAGRGRCVKQGPALLQRDYPAVTRLRLAHPLWGSWWKRGNGKGLLSERAPEVGAVGGAPAGAEAGPPARRCLVVRRTRPRRLLSLRFFKHALLCTHPDVVSQGERRRDVDFSLGPR